uniref:IGFBP N-terminal domain-containing protein n=1 Tax=Strigamia maritima TaxID=126957 RepID=T1JJC5_STRMM
MGKFVTYACKLPSCSVDLNDLEGSFKQIACRPCENQRGSADESERGVFSAPLKICFVDSHSCASCDLSRCQTPTDCAGGTTKDACGCCLTCARLANETCGGKFGLLGECDQGLVCLLKIQSGQPITGDEEGMCKEPQDACSTLHHYSGCNKVDMQCMCNTISTCEDPFFEHKTRLECEATLARLLVEESESAHKQ